MSVEHVPSPRATARRRDARSAMRVAARAWTFPASDAVALATLGVLTGIALEFELVYGASVLLLLAADGRHRPRICLRTSDEIPRIAAAAGLPLIVVLPWQDGGLFLGGCAAGLLVVFRGLVCAGLRAAHRRGVLVERALVIGTDPIASRVGRVLSEHPEYGLRVHGFVDRGPGSALPVTGDPAEVAELVRREGITRILVCFSTVHDEEMVWLLRSCRRLPVDVCLVPRLPELGMSVPRGDVDEVWGIPLIPLRRPTWLSVFGKRTFDVTVGAVLVVLTAPALGLLIVTSWLCHGRALFRQLRVTRGGRLTEVVKLRTVRSGSNSAWTVGRDQCGSLGRWLRDTHLDELPQLLNVLRGDMSLVGPRPERAYYAGRFAVEIPGYADRHRVAGGVTGWAQVHGLHGDTSISDRARFDNQYIDNWSLWMDVVILVRTAGIVLAALVCSAAPSGFAGRSDDEGPARDHRPGGWRSGAPVARDTSTHPARCRRGQSLQPRRGREDARR